MAVDDDNGLFDDASRANDDWSSEREDGCLGVDDGGGANRNVAFEVDILTDHSFRMDGEFIPSAETASRTR